MNIQHNIVYWCQTKELAEELKQECEIQKIKTYLIDTPKKATEFIQTATDTVPIVYDEYSMYNYEYSFYTHYEFAEKWNIYAYIGNGISIRYEDMGKQNILTYIDDKINLLDDKINKLGTLLKDKE